jgi:hypothetical protein
MLPAADFLRFWGLSFVTLSVALVLLSVFYRLIDSDLGLHGWGKEAVIAVIASLVQGAGLWVTASIIPGGGLRRQIIPSILVGIIYYATHIEKEWDSYEMAGIFSFQMAVWSVGFFMLTGEFKIAAVVLTGFVGALFIIGNSAKGL